MSDKPHLKLIRCYRGAKALSKIEKLVRRDRYGFPSTAHLTRERIGELTFSRELVGPKSKRLPRYYFVFGVGHPPLVIEFVRLVPTL